MTGDHDVESGSKEQETSKAHSSKKVDLSFDPMERLGLTSQQAEDAIAKYGYNELPEVTVSLWYVFLIQFTGTMPYMLELAAIISIAVQDYADFAIIAALLTANAVLGFQEQLKVANSLRELTQKLEAKIAVLRDGNAEFLLTRLLVPGDVVLLIGGVATPADIEWLEGDVLSVDTAPLTGEPIPRKYPSDDHGKLILAGTTIRAGEAYGIVRKTGANTEIGSASVDVLKDKTHAKVSVFEQRVLTVVKIVISAALLDVLIIFIIQGTVHNQFSTSGIRDDLLTCLSIIVASIPIALPIVLNVTMALGAGVMAREYDAVVTSLPALQDISSMTILCSDKTGTLTTAKISIHAESVWSTEGFSKEDVALYAGLASSRDKKEDAIDRSVIKHFDRVFGEQQAIQKSSEYTKVRNVGFNPIYKRVLYEYTHPTEGRITIAKGLPNKVLDTADGGEDDAADQWKCQHVDQLREVVHKVDYDFSISGYKTLGVAIKRNDDPWVFLGILPMLDPPRHDTAQTIRNLQNAGIEVKMITGDHLNIAKETARLIGLGTNIHPGEATRDESTKNEIIKSANGFAQVLPKDKREVVVVLRNEYKQVVGMTGDGVNDAPALSAAQCGVAVDDATDAAKNAAAIILTSPGLSAIYNGVVESRRIFRKLKAYVTYRFAASIQIVVVLTLLIFISNCSIDALLIILLALFNDLTLLPIAYDNQQASALPENPDVTKIISVSATLGALETGFTLLFCYVNGYTHLFSENYNVRTHCETPTQGAVWLQMFIATELLIFSARAPTYIFNSIAPSPYLAGSILIGCIIGSIISNLSSTFGNLTATDILWIWFYDIICLGVIDYVKVSIYKCYKLNNEVLKDAPLPPPDSISKKSGAGNTTYDKVGNQSDPDNPQLSNVYHQEESFRKDLHQISKIAKYADTKADLLPPEEKAIHVARRNTALKLKDEQLIAAERLPSEGGIKARSVLSETNIAVRNRESDSRIKVSAHMSALSVMPTSVINTNLRPNTPAFRHLNL